MLDRPCLEPGCPRLAAYRGRCHEHARAYDNRRGSPRERGPYHTPEWRALSKRILARDRICTVCHERPSTQADHIRPISEGGDVRSPSNLRGVCKPCHGRLTMALLRRRGKLGPWRR
jgi:5-methylcytosine-specific restriction protein A